MKKLEFETSKGRFVLVDIPSVEEIEKQLYIYGHDIGLTNHDLKDYYNNIVQNFKEVYELYNITEEQASEIVDNHNRLYNTYTEQEYGNMTQSAITSLHSLLKSKGIHLFENPLGKKEETNVKYIVDGSWGYVENLTFYNPVIFKL